MNIFHPLVEFHWTETSYLPHIGSLPQCTLLNGRLYVLGMQHKLYACSNTEELISWDLYSVPYCFASGVVKSTSNYEVFWRPGVNEARPIALCPQRG